MEPNHHIGYVIDNHGVQYINMRELLAYLIKFQLGYLKEGLFEREKAVAEIIDSLQTIAK